MGSDENPVALCLVVVEDGGGLGSEDSPPIVDVWGGPCRESSFIWQASMENVFASQAPRDNPLNAELASFEFSSSTVAPLERSSLIINGLRSQAKRLLLSGRVEDSGGSSA